MMCFELAKQNIKLKGYLLSSPTGPAEHCAGGSRAKSLSSFRKKRITKKKTVQRRNTNELSDFHFMSSKNL